MRPFGALAQVNDMPIGEAMFTSAWAIGQLLSLEQAIAEIQTVLPEPV
jgi:hypothetical protein